MKPNKKLSLMVSAFLSTLFSLKKAPPLHKHKESINLKVTPQWKHEKYDSIYLCARILYTYNKVILHCYEIRLSRHRPFIENHLIYLAQNRVYIIYALIRNACVVSAWRFQNSTAIECCA